MSVISVEIPKELEKNFSKDRTMSLDSFVRNIDPDFFIEFDFNKEGINQDEFLSYLKKKNG